MRQLRRKITLGDGAEVDLLFTPHLYSYKGRTGITLEYDSKDKLELLAVYADLMYLAALNAWELEGKGTVEDFPRTRADFHEWGAQDPAAFAATMDFTVEALTGKPLKVYAKEAEAEEPAEDGKKKRSGWITRLWRRSSSGGADGRSARRR